MPTIDLDQLQRNHDILRRELLTLSYEVKFRALMRALKANFDPDQPRDELGQWTDAGGALRNSYDAEQTRDPGEVFSIFADFDSVPFIQRIAQIAGSQTDADPSAPQPVGATVTYSNAVTGDSRIDETTDRLTRTVRNVMDVFDFIPYSTPRLYGTAVHSAFGAAVKLQASQGVEVEFSFRNEERATYGDEGSVRADVALRSVTGEVIAIYDLKTGSAVVRQSRADELRRHFGGSRYIPVIELHILRGSRIKHESLQTHFWSRPETTSRFYAVR